MVPDYGQVKLGLAGLVGILCPGFFQGLFEFQAGFGDFADDLLLFLVDDSVVLRGVDFEGLAEGGD